MLLYTLVSNCHLCTAERVPCFTLVHAQGLLEEARQGAAGAKEEAQGQLQQALEDSATKISQVRGACVEWRLERVDKDWLRLGNLV